MLSLTLAYLSEFFNPSLLKYLTSRAYVFSFGETVGFQGQNFTERKDRVATHF